MYPACICATSRSLERGKDWWLPRLTFFPTLCHNEETNQTSTTSASSLCTHPPPAAHPPPPHRRTNNPTYHTLIALTHKPCPIAQQAAKNYNVMGPAKASLESCARALAQELGPLSANIGPGGIRVNCLSPGPVRTMAARGISGFDEMRRDAAERSALGRDAGLEEIAGVATFLVSPLASAVTGQTVYADCGFSGVV